MKLQQNGQQYYNMRLLTTSTDAQPNKDTDTLISGLPYDTLDYDPKFTYIFVVHEIADKIEKSLPFKRLLFCRLMKLLEKQGTCFVLASDTITEPDLLYKS